MVNSNNSYYKRLKYIFHRFVRKMRSLTFFVTLVLFGAFCGSIVGRGVRPSTIKFEGDIRVDQSKSKADKPGIVIDPINDLLSDKGV